MGASSNKGGMGGPNTRAPGGGGMNYDGNPVGGGMGAQFNFGGPPRAVGGAYGKPIFGGSPLPGDLYNRGVNQIGQQIGVQPGGPGMIGQVLGRFQPRGMIPPAGGRIGNPRQVNPGQGGMRPGMPQPMPFPDQPGNPEQYPELFPPGGSPTPMPSPVPGRGKGGGGKGGMPGPGRPVFGPAPRPPTQPIFDPGFDGIGGDGGGGEPGVMPPDYGGDGGGGENAFGATDENGNGIGGIGGGYGVPADDDSQNVNDPNSAFYKSDPVAEPTPGPSFQNRSQVFNNRGRLGNQYTRTRAPRIR